MTKQTICMYLMAAAIVLLGVVTFRLSFNQPAYGVVRVDQVIADHMKNYVSQSTTERELEIGSETFSRAIHQVIEEYNERGIILFVDPAVVTELPDYTDVVASETVSRMERLKGEAGQ